MSISQDIVQNVLGYVQVSSLLAKRALDEVGNHRQRQKRAADMVPGLVDHFVTIKTIKDTEKQAALKLLGDPTEVLKLLKVSHDEVANLRVKLAEATRGASPEAGNAQGTKEAGITGDHATAPGEYNSLTDNRVGLRTSMKKASDIALGRGLNV